MIFKNRQEILLEIFVQVFFVISFFIGSSIEAALAIIIHLAVLSIEDLDCFYANHETPLQL